MVRSKRDEHDPGEDIPEGLRLLPLDPVFRERPHEVLKELREKCPVHRDRTFDRVVLSRHTDVEDVLRARNYWVDPRKSLPDDPVRRFADDDQEPSMLFLDAPDHQRLRNLVSRSFTPRRSEEWRPVVREVAAELLDAVDRAGEREFDLVKALAAPLPAIAIARILGVDPARQESFKAWSEASSAAFFNPFASEEAQRLGEEGYAALEECFLREIASRRETPADDLIGRLVAAEEDGDRLSEQELVTMCNLLLIAGNVTTSDLIGNGTRVLLQHPEALAQIRAAPTRITNAVEEMLRFDPPVTVSGRIASEDTEIDGVEIGARESVTTLLASANRDPAGHPDPDRFDIDRQDIRLLSFGGGAHLCLGAHLARVEAQEAIGALIARYPNLRAAESEEVWKQVPGFRGLAEFRVRID
ncbi:MAG: cytochrome P450 [Candidatus Binatia bacterium]|nr:cytochrome P450 [Candidatus Binatia bacterium]